MDKRKAKQIRSMVSITVVMIFFLIIIFAYYFMLSDETRSSIVKRGELAAGSFTEKINSYLATGMDCLTMTSYTLDNMLLMGRTNKDILEYLVNQTPGIISIMGGETTGLYAYVRDEYLDGAEWVPDADYVPKERPWYKEAMAHPGKVVVVDPYLDVYNGTITITLAKTLRYGENVVAMDVSLGRLQDIVETLTRPEDSDFEFILDGEHGVIAHSDKNEVGKDYSGKVPCLGAAIDRAHHATTESSFSVRYGDKEYMAYVMPLDNGWLCFSVIDTTTAYGRMNTPLILTIVVAALFVVFMLVIMFNSRRRSIISENAMAASEAKSAFLANMSHEIRTPINAMLGMDEMILRESHEKQTIEYADQIMSAGNTLLSIINDILDFSKIEEGKIELIPVQYNTGSFIKDIVNMIKERAEKKGLILNVEVDPALPTTLFGDEIRINQCIMNLLTNAVKYTESGSILFKVGFEKTDESHISLKISVTDTGIGIKKEDLEVLFSPFTRLEEKRNRSIEGTGLGMSITRRLLALMNSKLSVESTYGVGSVFSFAVVQKVEDWAEIGEYSKQLSESTEAIKESKELFKAPNARILAVDDTKVNLSVITKLLKRTGVMVDTAFSGSQAIEMAKTTHYDIMLIDHMMPIMDGIETLQKLKEMDPDSDTVYIALTANAIAGAREMYLASGFNDYISKPVKGSVLEATLKAHLPQDKIIPY